MLIWWIFQKLEKTTDQISILQKKKKIVYTPKKKFPFLIIKNTSEEEKEKMEGEESIHHIEDLGRILLQTEDELKKMSKSLLSGADVWDEERSQDLSCGRRCKWSSREIGIR